jgi:hypothetical protein
VLGNGVADYELINEKKSLQLNLLARVGGTTNHYKTVERFANSTDSRVYKIYIQLILAKCANQHCRFSLGLAEMANANKQKS